MKSMYSKFIFGFLLLLFPTLIFSQGWWFRKADLDLSSRTAAVGFSIGTGGFIGTGFDSATYRRNFSSYNNTTETWTQVQSMGGTTGSGLSRCGAAVFVIGSSAFVATGQGSNPYLLDVWEYNASTDTWSQKANFAGTARRSAVGFSLNNNGYVVCGQDASGFKNDLWMYDPVANAWISKATFAGTARRLPVAFVLNGTAYVGTGDDGTFKKDFFQYNPTTNTWLSVANFGGTPRYGAAAFALGNDGYVGTGYDNTLANRKDFWKYNALTNIWSVITDFAGTPRSNAVAFSIGAYGFLGTGYGTLTEKDFWRYDPLSNGIEEMNKLRSSVKVYPNPMISASTLSFDPSSVNAFNKISFMVFNMNGKIVKQLDNIRSSEISIERGNLPAGIYVYKLIADDHPISSGKIILQ